MDGAVRVLVFVPREQPLTRVTGQRRLDWTHRTSDDDTVNDFTIEEC